MRYVVLLLMVVSCSVPAAVKSARHEGIQYFCSALGTMYRIAMIDKSMQMSPNEAYSGLLQDAKALGFTKDDVKTTVNNVYFSPDFNGFTAGNIMPSVAQACLNQSQGWQPIK